ncbi:MAG: fumarylacetoacetate hydrolase family protein [Pseudomonadota bacterium]
MTTYVFDPPPPPSLAIDADTRRFPIRRIYGVGQNYDAHTREMGGDPVREAPFFFTKPSDCLAPVGRVAYPPHTNRLQHEVELVVALNQGGQNLTPAEAGAAVWGAAVGLDLTLRDLMETARAMGQPWDLSKGFDAAAAIGPLSPIADVPSLQTGAIRLWVNGSLRQTGDLGEMIWPVCELISILSRQVTLAKGDIIMTGTPAGVGTLVPGDEVEASIAGLAPLLTRVAMP